MNDHEIPHGGGWLEFVANVQYLAIDHVHALFPSCNFIPISPLNKRSLRSRISDSTTLLTTGSANIHDEGKLWECPASSGVDETSGAVEY